MEYKGQHVEAIDVNGIDPGTRGIILDQDPEGAFYVKWFGIGSGVIRERGDRYKFITKPKNNFWIIKYYYLSLMTKLKTMDILKNTHWTKLLLGTIVGIYLFVKIFEALHNLNIL